jgi:predicted pyridoxine 5'-phosphate oxidase superfamily flavin-nucleotide-binding protein
VSGDAHDDAHTLPLAVLAACFEGFVPSTIATVSADGTPNVTYLSKVHAIDDEHVALSNQFFSKTSRNLAENPRACVLVIDPERWDQYRLTLLYERTERHGPVFDRLYADIEVLAAVGGFPFKLRSADIYRVLRVEAVGSAARAVPQRS